MFRRYIKDHMNDVILEVHSIFAAYEWTIIFTGMIIAIFMLWFTNVKEYSTIPIGISGLFCLLKIARRMYAMHN